jgi:hypothetical protein
MLLLFATMWPSLCMRHTACWCFLQPYSAHFITYKHMIFNWKWLLCNSQEVIEMTRGFPREQIRCRFVLRSLTKIFFLPFPNIFMEFTNLCGTTCILSQTLMLLPTHSQHPSRLQTCPYAVAGRWNRHLHNLFVLSPSKRILSQEVVLLGLSRLTSFFFKKNQGIWVFLWVVLADARRIACTTVFHAGFLADAPAACRAHSSSAVCSFQCIHC